MKVAFSNKSGISMALVTRSDNYWDLFWSTLVSATVENEAPDEVVLTFGLANTSLTKDDFSIEGFTIDSLSRDATNKILTLILTEDFESDTEAEITFGKTGESYSITNNVTAFDWDAYWEDAYFQDGEIFDNGKVVLQFDDGYADSYTNGLPLFLSKGIKATYFIVPQSIGIGECMSWAQAQDLYANGMDVQCHTNTHPNLSDTIDADIITELNDSTAAFLAHGLPAPEHIAYPGGYHDDRVLDVVDDLRVTGRSTVYGQFNRKSGKYNIPTVYSSYSVEVIKAQMDLCKLNKTAMCLYGHRIGDEPALSITIAKLTELIDYAQSIGLDFITTEELYDLMFYIDIRLSRSGSDDEINVICRNRLHDSDSISLERSDDDGATYTEIAVLTATNPEYDDTGLTLSKNYFYRARGFKSDHYLPYSRVEWTSTKMTALVLTSTGTGLGVSTLQLLEANENVTLTLDGVGKFYTDAAGTLNESATWLLLAGVQATRYVRVASGASNLTITKNIITDINGWISGANAASLGGDISLWSKLEHLAITGTNTLSGDMAKIIRLNYLINTGTNTLSGDMSGLTDLTYVSISGSNTIFTDITNLTKLTHLNISAAGAVTTGDITNLISLDYISLNVGTITISGSISGITGLAYIVILGANTISGDVSLLPLLNYLYVGGTNTIGGSLAGLTLLTYLRVSGSNTLTGSISALTLLTYVSIGGFNTISGDVSLITVGLTRCSFLTCGITEYTAGGNWASISASGFIHIVPAVGYGLSSAEVDLLLNEISATKVEGRAITVDLRGSNAARTAASDAAVADIIADGGTVYTN